ncbi:MAG: hypothetical protein L6Q92_06195 [Phycisphaerae bacterium]|nr:hypothetical protein [Phycisphaerae bacterium]
MSDAWLAIFVQAIGLALFVLEVFLPSHGMLGIGGAGCIVGGLYLAFRVGLVLGYVSLAAQVLLVPIIAIIGVRVFRRTTVGRWIAPPNPVLTPADTSLDVRALQSLIGTAGRSISPLRPAGICEFNGRRVQCAAESGFIDPDSDVEGVGIVSGALIVRATRRQQDGAS